MSEMRLQRLTNRIYSATTEGWPHQFIIRHETDLGDAAGFDAIVDWCRGRHGAPVDFGPRLSDHAVWTTDDLLMVFFHDDHLAFEFMARWC